MSGLCFDQVSCVTIVLNAYFSSSSSGNASYGLVMLAYVNIYPCIGYEMLIICNTRLFV